MPAAATSAQPSFGSSGISSGTSGAASAFKALRSGQFEELRWNEFFDSMEYNGQVPIYQAGSVGHVFLCLHGAGSSALTFAPLAEHLKATGTVIAFDWRGHGQLLGIDDKLNLNTETLIQDTIEVLEYVRAKFPERSILLIGHAMGGALATKTLNFIEREMANSDL